MNALRAWAERDGRGYPDWAMRYRPVVKRLHRWLAGEGLMLEIGANANGLARFAARPVIAVDISMQSLRECKANRHALPVRADITALPFADESMRTCACMDTFEHLPPVLRMAASTEILRVLQRDGAAVIGFPSGTKAAAAEGRIREAYRASTGGTIRWLEEHLENGLPDGEAIAGDLARMAGEDRAVQRMPNANLLLWEWTWRILMCGWPGRGNSIAQVLLRLFTPVLARAHFGACYRTLIYILPRKIR